MQQKELFTSARAAGLLGLTAYQFSRGCAAAGISAKYFYTRAGSDEDKKQPLYTAEQIAALQAARNG